MNKTFYEQSGGLDAEVTFSAKPQGLFTFGFSGSDSLLSFSGQNGMLFDSSGRMLGPCCDYDNSLGFYSHGGICSIFLNSRLINTIDVSSSTYSGFNANSDHGFSTRLKVYADPPAISGGAVTIGDDGTGTGEFTLYGDHPLRINNLEIDETHDFDIISWGDVAQTGVNQFTFSGSGAYSSGSFLIHLDTDAGNFSRGCSVFNSGDPAGGFVNFWIKRPARATKTQTINFYVANRYQTAQNVNFSLFSGKQPTGITLSVDASGTGVFNTGFNFSGPKIINATFSGNVTGAGGRSGEQTVLNNFTQEKVFTMIPTGSETRTVRILASGDINGELYFGYMDVTGAAISSGGRYHYEFVNETGVPDWANRAGTYISPLPSDIFTGSANISFPVTGTFSGDLKAVLNTTVDVSEGDVILPDAWDIVYEGTSFKTSGWYDASGVGVGSPSFSIPASTTISGQIKFSTDVVKKRNYAVEFGIGGDSSLTVNNYV